MAWVLKMDEVIESGLVHDFDASLSGIGQELGAGAYSMRYWGPVGRACTTSRPRGAGRVASAQPGGGRARAAPGAAPRGLFLRRSRPAAGGRGFLSLRAGGWLLGAGVRGTKQWNWCWASTLQGFGYQFLFSSTL